MRAKVFDIIIERRKTLPREGGRKLHKAIEEDMRNNGIHIGRDRFFDLAEYHKNPDAALDFDTALEDIEKDL